MSENKLNIGGNVGGDVAGGDITKTGDQEITNPTPKETPSKLQAFWKLVKPLLSFIPFVK